MRSPVQWSKMEIIFAEWKRTHLEHYGPKYNHYIITIITIITSLIRPHILIEYASQSNQKTMTECGL